MDVNITNELIPSLPDIEYQDYIENDIPISVYLAMLSVVGTTGNAHAICVYFLRYKPSNYRTFVVWLAAIDLIACCLSIPFELFDIRFSSTFTADGACRFFRYLNHFVSICSGSLLGVIAVDRFRKACRPFGRQLEGNGAMIACMVTVGVSAVASFPALVMYGVQVEKVHEFYNINGTDCKVLDTFKNALVFKGFQLVLLFLSTVVFLMCVVIYVFVGRVLYHQYMFRNSIQMKKGVATVSGNTSTGTTHAQRVHEDELTDESSMANNSLSRTKIMNQNGDKPLKQKTRRFDRSKQITFMFLVATGVSYLGYLPSLILTIVKALGKGKSINLVLGAFGDILLRGYFISNVANPLVYCFLDNKFRKECRALYRAVSMQIGRCFCRKNGTN